MVYLNIKNKWDKIIPEQKTVFVIRPGAGTFRNKKAYDFLEKEYNVVYFGQTGGEYDNYPNGWQDNKNILSTGKHLGGIAELVKTYIQKYNIIPSIIIAGSRGGQVTIGKIWEIIWRGPTVVINAGCLLTNTKIYKETTPLFITMENDYFTSVNTISKVKTLFDIYKSTKYQHGFIIHLKGHYHMPNLNNSHINLLSEACHFLTENKFDKNIDIYKL